MTIEQKSGLPGDGMSYPDVHYLPPKAWKRKLYRLFGLTAPDRVIKSGAASPARRISSTDPANGDPGEANT